jgi:hypothetical protein
MHSNSQNFNVVKDKKTLEKNGMKYSEQKYSSEINSDKSHTLTKCPKRFQVRF